MDQRYRHSSKPNPDFPHHKHLFLNHATLDISGDCVDGNLVSLSGSATQSVVCNNWAYSFMVNEPFDGIYSYAVKQTGLSGIDSVSQTLTWNLDTAPPAAVTITNPTSSPYISADTTFVLAGTCESNATVVLAGSESGSTVCSNSAFSFNLTQNIDGHYTYNITQNDPAGNSSEAIPFEWTRNTVVPNIPVINSPSSNPFHSNQSSLTIVSSCGEGNTVKLEGADLQSSICTNGSGLLWSTSWLTISITLLSKKYLLLTSNLQPPHSVGTEIQVRRSPLHLSPLRSARILPDITLTFNVSCETGSAVSLSLVSVLKMQHVKAPALILL